MTHRLDPLVSMQMRSVVFPWPPKLMIIFLVASATMLAATLLLHVPLMLWDHIDLVPMYEAWRQGDLKISEFWRIHDGSHFHSAAYAVLLLTTWLSGGRPWLDCVVSWVVFAAMAWALIALARMGWRDQHPGRFWWGLAAAGFSSGSSGESAMGLAGRRVHQSVRRRDAHLPGVACTGDASGEFHRRIDGVDGRSRLYHHPCGVSSSCRTARGKNR